ncbi:MAG: hypothetical protein Ct9H300mP21_11200 [Pseudomonadota bacterium]|nr:MAG: hypothetical protein Ct9H300mP21_11200 [Pseudomonadota bacterium]
MSITSQSKVGKGDSFFLGGGKIGVLLLHGLLQTPAEVRPPAKRFHDSGFTVSGVLLPGHGTTPENLNETSRQNGLEPVKKHI